MSKETTELIFYVLYAFAFAASLLAFAMTSIQKLRFLIVLSSSAYAVYYWLFPAEPLWLDIGSELSLISINGFMIVYMAWSNSRIKFDQREQFLYENEFSDLTRFEFNQLLKISAWELKGAGHVYTVAGQRLQDIFYLVSGRAKAELPDGHSVVVSEGSVIGEVSFRLECPASATVTGTDSCMCLRWNQQELKKLCDKYPNIKRVVDNVLSSHMARKLSDPPQENPAASIPVG
ncbi:MAG: cyclic nucleotide-binding domain-containing protein [Lysobacterales bacterium]|jgi:hypothetical protein